MYKNKLEIDFLDIEVEVNHCPTKLSNGYHVYNNNSDNIEDSKISYISKNIYSEFNSKLKIKSIKCVNDISNKLKISGNFYKWLYGQNVTGCSNLIELVLLVIHKLKKSNLIDPTEEQLKIIKFGYFTIFRVDVKKDILFESKQNALEYLNNIKNLSSYPYRDKVIFTNGVYYGYNSRSWRLCIYHKGRELSSKDNIALDLKEKANLMIRQEIRIYSIQLSEWDLKIAWKWLDMNFIDKFFNNIFNDIRVPDTILKDANNSITNKSDRKFYNCLINGDIENTYSRTVIFRKSKEFADKYNIDIKKYL